MKIIEQKYLDVNGSQDIFGYFRQFYGSSSPHDDGLITLFSPGTYFSSNGQEEYLQANISTLISTPDNFRWISTLDDPYFTIDFHSTQISLLYYTFETHQNVRYIKEWAVYGLKGNKEYIIDQRNTEPLCNYGCTSYTTKTFKCQNPGTFTKFKIISTGPDSSSEVRMSLSAIQFFGFVSAQLPFTFNSQFLIRWKFFMDITFVFFLK